MNEKSSIKKQLASHLKGGQAFLPVDELLKKITFDRIGERPDNLPYSFYELFYHIRFAQKDILDYCAAESYTPRNWPGDYWPDHKAPRSAEDWEELKKKYDDERQELIDLVLNPNTDLLASVQEDTDHTLLREALLVIEHTAYHTGQLLVVLRSLGLYK